jgi:hypothetical protein
MKTRVLAQKKWGANCLTTMELLSPAQIDKLSGGKEFTKKMTTSVSSGVTLAPESDKRPEINPAAKDFDCLDVAPAIQNEKPKQSRKVSKTKTVKEGKNGKRKNGR